MRHNAQMPTIDKKRAFSERLRLALRRSQESVEGATNLAVQFSLRYAGSAISPQTAHKWLNGGAVPTEDKLVILSDWLNVDKHWLHYGPPPDKSEAGSKANTKKVGGVTPSPEAMKLAQKIQTLAPHQRYLIEELVSQFHE